MPCYKCSNGKYKYGLKGNCQFDTLGACQSQLVRTQKVKKER